DFTGNYYPSDNLYSMQIIEDYEDYYTHEYYMKVKCVATNGLDVWILISGFPVYCEFKINEENEQNDNTKILKILNFITSLNYTSWTIDTKDVFGKKFHFLRVFFMNHNIRKQIIKKIQLNIKNKGENYEIFDLYEDDISTLYSVFIAPRTQVVIDGVKRGFPLSKTFKTNRTLSKDMYQNKFNYRMLKFEDDFDAYISMYFDYETVDIDNLKKNELGRVSTGFIQDRAFMGVFVFFKGREIKPFYIVAILMQNDEFPVEYEKINDNWWNNLGYDWKFILRKLYELQLFSDFMRIATGKEKETEDIIKWDRRNDYITINA
ncbi:13858_t:CDS:2, partial [Cetraspora pellucida]